MELKKYQKTVISELNRYLALLRDTKNLETAFRRFWEEKDVPVGSYGVKAYQNILPSVPNICMKVPTGGGKTFLACNAVKPIFDALPESKAQVVVWLVPSDAILSQTLAALRNPEHAYRQKLNSDFGNRVEVYTKEALLSGQNFNITAVTEQLSVMVLSYDSFRGRKEALRAKRENSALAPMAKALGVPANPIEDADETALIQIINQLSPLVIVDESHHAKSKLSREMLQNFNPCFVLDLTATPTKESNILCYVDAVQLKKENMVKLPVIVYNRNSQQEVLADAIDLRNRLEEQAEAAKEEDGYIRPIVLFQAQPKVKEDSTSFEKLRDKLIDAGIPKEQIAIKTAEVNELKNTELQSASCPIRYIITVNALKEGWDCPFAYILASLANKTSQVDVEQIVGRVLRQPYATRHSKPALNMSYVLTSSNDFKATLDRIVLGLNGAGFSSKDYRVGSDSTAKTEQPTPITGEQMPFIPQTEEQPAENGEEFLNFDAASLGAEVQQRKDASNHEGPGVSGMLNDAEKAQEQFNASLEAGMDSAFGDVPTEVREHMHAFHIHTEFEEEVEQLALPQFFLKVPGSFFTEGTEVLLTKEQLAQDFTLRGKPYPTDFAQADSEIVRVDINDAAGSTPRVFKMSETDQRYFKEQFSKFSPEKKVKVCKDIIHKQLNKMDLIDDRELADYVDLIVANMDKYTLAALEKSPQGFALRIKRYIEKLLDQHNEQTFKDWLVTGKIVCEPYYHFPTYIAPLNSTAIFGGCLYEEEEEVNDFEYKMVMALTGFQNVKWWHRNIAKKGFCINGYMNHYPDFIVMTKSGKIVMIETKGDHLDNTDSRQKAELGARWEKYAGPTYRYFMVFESKDIGVESAFSMERFTALFPNL